MWRVEFDLRAHQNRIYRNRINPLEYFSDEEFFVRYRFPKNIVRELCDKFRHNLERPTNRSSSLSVEVQICIGLRYFSQGGYLPVIGDIHGVSPRSTSRAIHAVANALCDDHRDYISWPTNEEFNRTKTLFYNYSAFPKVVGVIDGCHIPITAPSLPFSEAAFINRKGYHSINALFVCDFNLQTFNMSAEWPGSTHDSFILRQSPLWRRHEEFDGWLLGKDYA